MTGRPTDDEFDMIENVVDEYFVGDSYTFSVMCWDDGDVHITAFSTLGTNVDDGYPLEVVRHRQTVTYKREDTVMVYRNRVRRMAQEPNTTLNHVELDPETFM